MAVRREDDDPYIVAPILLAEKALGRPLADSEKPALAAKPEWSELIGALDTYFIRRGDSDEKEPLEEIATLLKVLLPESLPLHTHEVRACIETAWQRQQEGNKRRHRDHVLSERLEKSLRHAVADKATNDDLLQATLGDGFYSQATLRRMEQAQVFSKMKRCCDAGFRVATAMQNQVLAELGTDAMTMANMADADTRRRYHDRLTELGYDDLNISLSYFQNVFHALQTAAKATHIEVRGNHVQLTETDGRSSSTVGYEAHYFNLEAAADIVANYQYTLAQYIPHGELPSVSLQVPAALRTRAIEPGRS